MVGCGIRIEVTYPPLRGGEGVRAAYPSVSDKLAIRRREIAKEEGVDGLLTNCPFCILAFERGLALKQEEGE